MQTSHSSQEWNEDSTLERMRDAAATNTGTSRKLLRQLFPLTAMVLKGVSIYGVKEGEVLAYVRTKMVPACFPIEALVVTESAVHPGTAQTRRCSFKSSELELIGLGDDAEGTA